MTTIPTAESDVRVESGRSRFVLDGWRGIVLLALVVFCGFWQLHVHNRIMGPNYSDLVTRWVATRAAIAGLDPYSDDVLPDMLRMYYGHYPLTAADPSPERQRFYYPANLVLLLMPIAYFNWPTARVIFMAVTIVLLIGGFRGCIEMYPPRWTKRQIAMVLVLAVCSWPVLWGLRLQQPSLLIAAFVLLACFYLHRGRDRAAGILLALSTVKPQLDLPILAWLVLWAIVHRRWRFLGWFAGTLAAFLLWTESLTPGWVSHWRASVGIYVRSTETAPALENLLGHWAGLALALLIAFAICSNLWRLLRADSDSVEFTVAVGLVLALTVLFNPTHLAMIYNQVLLFPACLFVLRAAPADRDGKIVRWVVLALLWITFALPVASVIGESISYPSVIWDALPYFCNSPLIGAVAIAAAILASQRQMPIRRLLEEA